MPKKSKWDNDDESQPSIRTTFKSMRNVEDRSLADTAPKKTGIASSRYFTLIILVSALVLLTVIYFIVNAIVEKSQNPPVSNVTASPGATVEPSKFALDATEDYNLEEILSYGLPVMITFGTAESKATKEFMPLLVSLNEELRGRAVIKYVDADKNKEASNTVPLNAIPTEFFFNPDGTPYIPDSIYDASLKGYVIYTDKENGDYTLTAHQGILKRGDIIQALTEMGME